MGSIEERKNLMLVAKAMAELNRRNRSQGNQGSLESQGNQNQAQNQDAAAIHVVAVGRRTAYVDQIQDFLKAQGIDYLFHFYHQVPYADLPSFYKWASTFAYPSRIEGFGIPLLEAISSGVPAIGCTGSCLEEAGGPNSIYVNPDDEKGMANAILRTCTDESLRQHMINEGKNMRSTSRTRN